MGYETKFSLSFTASDKVPVTKEHILLALSEITEYEWEDDMFIQAKWYEWKDDMKTLSMKFPDVFFELSGEGEEAGDMWKAYFQKGLGYAEKAKITFAPYKKSKMH